MLCAEQRWRDLGPFDRLDLLVGAGVHVDRGCAQDAVHHRLRAANSRLARRGPALEACNARDRRAGAAAVSPARVLQDSAPGGACPRRDRVHPPSGRGEPVPRPEARREGVPSRVRYALGESAGGAGACARCGRWSTHGAALRGARCDILPPVNPHRAVAARRRPRCRQHLAGRFTPQRRFDPWNGQGAVPGWSQDPAAVGSTFGV